MQAPPERPRILLVEDEMMVADVLDSMLTDFGYRVVGPATSVKQAMEMVTDLSFDAAVLDVNLGGEMSYCVADALAARGRPFLFSTGYQKDSLRIEYDRRPVLQKPFRSLRLKQAIAALLEEGQPASVARH